MPHDHEHGHTHVHSHSHAAVPASLVQMGAGARLLAAAGLCVLIWAMILAVLA